MVDEAQGNVFLFGRGNKHPLFALYSVYCYGYYSYNMIIKRKTEEKNMLTVIFAILVLALLGKLIVLAIKASWGIFKVLVCIVFFPVILIVMFASGLIWLAIILAIIAGLASLVFH